MDRLGRYEIIEKIGEGGIGAVYKAKCPTLNKIVALKVMVDFCAKDEELLERFYREARILASLGDYSHVVQIHGLDQADGKYFYVMEYIPFSLSDYIGEIKEDEERTRVVKKESRVLPVDEAMDIVQQVLMGLSVIHKAGVIHRGISFQNLLMKKEWTDYRVKISDFGIAKTWDMRLKNSGVRGMGKEAYTSPEQREDFSSADERSDLYSIGGLMYRMVTGRLPEGRLKEPKDLNKHVSSTLNDWILKAFEYDPEDRFQSAQEMLEELRRISRGQESEGARREEPSISGKKMVQKGEQRYFLRSEPRMVSHEERKKTLNLDDDFHPLQYVEKDFEDNGDGTVTDHATRLMWQQSGSDKFFPYKEAQGYIKEINRKRFAGYNDWRLPTVPELKSLLEPEKRSNGLYIDPVFDESQVWFWSADERLPDLAWSVDFENGLVHWIDIVYYVRAVRSLG